MSELGIIIVTGASRGVGRATVISLVRDHGREVLAIARSTRSLDVLAEELKDAPGHLRTLTADLTSPALPAQLNAALGDRTVAALVNNAGLLLKRDFGQWTSEDMQQLYEVNVVAPLLLVQTLLHRFSILPAAHVVNIGSMGGVRGTTKFQGLLGYSVSKGALVTLTECLAEELKEKGVRVNCLSLGAVDTEMLREAFPGYQAPVSADRVGEFVARFSLEGHNLFNSKVLEVAVDTP